MGTLSHENGSQLLTPTASACSPQMLFVYLYGCSCSIEYCEVPEVLYYVAAILLPLIEHE